MQELGQQQKCLFSVGRYVHPDNSFVRAEANMCTQIIENECRFTQFRPNATDGAYHFLKDTILIIFKLKFG